MPLIDDVFAVIIDGSLLGPLLGFDAQVRLATINRACSRLYRAAWPHMWRARVASSVSATFKGPKHEVRRMLRRAVEHSKPEHVRVLVDRAIEGCEKMQNTIQSQLFDGQSFLHIAARLIRNRFTAERLNVLELLLEAGGKELACQRIVRIRNDDVDNNATALHLCATSNSVIAVEALVQVGGKSLLFARTGRGATCLHSAVVSGNPAVVRTLIELGGSRLLEARDTEGNSCLMKAAAAGRVDHVRTLVREGGKSFLMLRNINGASCLFIAAQHGRLAVVEELIRCGGRELLMTTLNDGASCLSVAAVHSYLDVVLCLISHGGRELVNIVTTDIGTSALHLAAFKGSRAIAEALVACGGQELMMMRLRGNHDDGRTCLHVAASQGATDVAMFLYERGGNELLFATDNENRSALFLAVGQGHSDVVVRMLYVGGPQLLMLCKSDDSSCLVLAAKRGNCEMVSMLFGFANEFRKGPDGTVCNNSANKFFRKQLKLALAACTYHGHRDVIEYLQGVSARRIRPTAPPVPPPLQLPPTSQWFQNFAFSQSTCCIF